MFWSLYSGPHQLKSGCYPVGAIAKEISHGYTQPHRTLQKYFIECMYISFSMPFDQTIKLLAEQQTKTKL